MLKNLKDFTFFPKIFFEETCVDAWLMVPLVLHLILVSLKPWLSQLIIL